MRPFHGSGAFRQGSGWRVGWQPGRGRYCALVGGDLWGLELTEGEWREFVAACEAIQGGLKAVVDRLMPEESVTLEQEGERVTVIAMGLVTELTLYIRVSGDGDRQCEGFWQGEAISELWQAIAELVEAAA